MIKTSRRFATRAFAGAITAVFASALLGTLSLSGGAWAESNDAQNADAQEGNSALIQQLKADNPGIAYLESLDGIDTFVAPSKVDWRYETVIYINLAPKGSTAQRMWVLHRDRDGQSAEAGSDAIATLIATAGEALPEGQTPVEAAPWRIGMWDEAYWDKRDEVPTYSWLISSGRKYPGDQFSGPTPAGVFNLDERRGRQKLGFYSAGMYDAMFIDLHYSSGRRSGVALHGTNPSLYRNLGRVDSHGCIRMHKRNSRALFDRVMGRDGFLADAQIKGEVPRFFRSSPTGSVRRGYNRQGELQFADDGSLLTKDGFRTLVVMFKDYKGALPKIAR
jgi:hypothetical protein